MYSIAQIRPTQSYAAYLRQWGHKPGGLAITQSYTGTRIANPQNLPYTLAPGNCFIYLHQNEIGSFLKKHFIGGFYTDQTYIHSTQRPLMRLMFKAFHYPFKAAD
jgi:hypothetical protein